MSEDKKINGENDVARSDSTKADDKNNLRIGDAGNTPILNETKSSVKHDIIGGGRTSHKSGSVLDEIIVKRDSKGRRIESGEVVEVSNSESSDDEVIFQEYMGLDEIGEKIFKELYERFDKERKGFRMDDLSKDSVGLLSQCQNLQAWVSLSLDFGLPFTSTDIIDEQEFSIKTVMDMVVKDIISRVTVTENGVKSYVFGASPYISDKQKYFTEEYSNMDAITWVIPTFITILKLYADRNESSDIENDIIDIIKYGIKYINEAFINGERDLVCTLDYLTNDDGNEKGCLKTGWNFTKECEEPSLYYTFAVGECYLDLYKAFEEILAYGHAQNNKMNSELSLDLEADAKAKHDALFNAETCENYIANNQLARIYRRLCDFEEGAELVVHGTEFGKLGENLKKTGFAIWARVKDKLADNFLYNDLAETLTEKDIMMSTTSDALFNTVYIVNIMLAGGVDEFFSLKQKAASLRGESKIASIARRGYDNILESCMLAVQKAFRTYEKLKNNAKDYIVDQYLILFNEKFGKHEQLAGELRKYRMKTCSLLPLLIHTNNVISEYLIKFPHYNMRRYLEYILENRYETSDSESAHWIWEKDGYFSGSNCYYIVALLGFYKYYENYEKKFIPVAKKRKAVVDEVKAEHLRALEAPNGAIGLLAAAKAAGEEAHKHAIAEKDAEIEELKGIKRPIEDAVKAVMAQELEKSIVSVLTKVFLDAASSMTVADVDIAAIDPTTEDDDEYTGLFNAVISMIVAKNLAQYYGNDVGTDKVGVEEYKIADKKGRKYLLNMLLKIISDAQHSA